MNLNNVKNNINRLISFSVKPTLSSKHYLNLIKQAKLKNFHSGINNPLINIARASSKVQEGDHHVPEGYIVRSYH